MPGSNLPCRRAPGDMFRRSPCGEGSAASRRSWHRSSAASQGTIAYGVEDATWPCGVGSLSGGDTVRAGDEFVAGAVNGQEVARIGGIGLKLLPQPQDVIVDGARRRIVLIAPD